MISSSFYNKKNTLNQLLGGNVSHYPIKNPSVTLEWYNYTMLAGETLYTVAERIFGEDLEHLWTYIADNNPPRFPDDWHTGDIVRLPKVIVRDLETSNVR